MAEPPTYCAGYALPDPEVALLAVCLHPGVPTGAAQQRPSNDGADVEVIPWNPMP